MTCTHCGKISISLDEYKKNTTEFFDEIESAIKEYEKLIESRMNSGNDIEMFQRGCIVGLNKARSILSQIKWS